MGKLTGKTALITGASQGIGEGIARVFARHGANLILLDISDEIEKLADELGGRGHRCTAVKADVRDFASVQAAVARAKETEGRIDILVNNAGVCRLGNFLDMSEEDRDFHIDINIKGVWNVTKAVLPEMIKRKDGRIVMMSSVTGDMVADPGETAYAHPRRLGYRAIWQYKIWDVFWPQRGAKNASAAIRTTRKRRSVMRSGLWDEFPDNSKRLTLQQTLTEAR